MTWGEGGHRELESEGREQRAYPEPTTQVGGEKRCRDVGMRRCTGGVWSFFSAGPGSWVVILVLVLLHFCVNAIKPRARIDGGRGRGYWVTGNWMEDRQGRWTLSKSGTGADGGFRGGRGSGGNWRWQRRYFSIQSVWGDGEAEGQGLGSRSSEVSSVVEEKKGKRKGKGPKTPLA